MTSQDADKRRAAAQAVQYIESGMRVGLGSGSTSAAAVRLLGERIAREGLEIVGVPTSAETRALAQEVGVPLLEDLSGFELDIAIDGADEATPGGWLIKGGGGAMLRERIVAAAARKFIVMVDASKMVDRLGKFPLPVEVFALGFQNVQQRLQAHGAATNLRVKKTGGPFITDEGNYILDCRFPDEAYRDAPALATLLQALPGVADHGLFLGMADLLVISRAGAIEEVPLKRSPA